MLEPHLGLSAMKRHTILFATAALLCLASSAQAAEEFSCTGPDSVSGKAIGPTTMRLSGFACPGAPAPYNALGDRAGQAAPQASRTAPFVVVNFKARSETLKTGDTVVVKGHFSVVTDPDHQLNYVVISDAEGPD
jgi:hypothetical protein